MWTAIIIETILWISFGILFFKNRKSTIVQNLASI